MKSGMSTLSPSKDSTAWRKDGNVSATSILLDLLTDLITCLRFQFETRLHHFGGCKCIVTNTHVLLLSCGRMSFCCLLVGAPTP